MVVVVRLLPPPISTNVMVVAVSVLVVVLLVLVVVVSKIQKLGETTQTVDFPKSDEESFENFRYGFGTPKGHTFSS